jgi:hypothetical protein
MVSWIREKLCAPRRVDRIIEYVLGKILEDGGFMIVEYSNRNRQGFSPTKTEHTQQLGMTQNNSENVVCGGNLYRA